MLCICFITQYQSDTSVSYFVLSTTSRETDHLFADSCLFICSVYIFQYAHMLKIARSCIVKVCQVSTQLLSVLLTLLRLDLL